MLLYVVGCTSDSKEEQNNNQNNDTSKCSLSLKYADYMDSFNLLNVDSSSSTSVNKKLDEYISNNNDCQQVNLVLSDISVTLSINYTTKDSNHDYTISKTKYGSNSVTIDKSLKYLVLQKIESDVIINVTDDSYVMGNAILIKNKQFYSLTDIDYVAYESGNYTYTKYNHDYIKLLSHTCDSSMGLTDSDMKKYFEEHGTLSFSGNKHSLTKISTATVAKQCGRE